MPAEHSETDTDADRDEPQADDKGDQDPPTRPRRRRFLIGAVAAALVVLIVVVVVLLTKSSGGGGASGGNTVAQAAAATAGQQYAAVNVNVKMKSGDKAAASTVSGFSVNGAIDFASSLGALNLTGPDKGASEQMVLDNQTIYLDPGALVGQLVKNKVWISATADDLGANPAPSGFALPPTLFVQLVGSPTTLLRQLETSGVTATAGHSSIYQGTPVQEYDVTLSQQAINARLQGLPSSLRGLAANGTRPGAGLPDDQRTGAGDLGAHHGGEQRGPSLGPRGGRLHLVGRGRGDRALLRPTRSSRGPSSRRC